VSGLEGLIALGGTDVLAALQNNGGASGQSPVTPQVTPATLTDIAAIVLSRKASGKFMVFATLGWTGVNTDTYTFALRHYVEPAGTSLLPLGNATSAGAGTNAYNATASGPITYNGAPTPVLDTTTGTIEVITGELTQQITLFAPVGPIPAGDNVAFALAVQASAGNLILVANSLSFFAIELP